MIISIDLDNVVFNQESLTKAIFKENNIEYIPPETWDFKNYPKNIKKQIISKFETPEWTTGELINKRLPLLIKKLNSKHKLYFVPARSFKIKKETIEQVKESLPFIKENQIYFTNGQDKAELLKQLKVDYHIDDSPSVVQECLDNNIGIKMISTKETKYNHYMRKEVDYYNELSKVLIKLNQKEK